MTSERRVNLNTDILVSLEARIGLWAS